jgi:hypothetical protein
VHALAEQLIPFLYTNLLPHPLMIVFHCVTTAIN